MSRKNIWMDCDPGIDDAVALAMAAASRDSLILQGISTVAVSYTHLNTRAFKIEVSLDNQHWTTVVDERYNASFQNDENFDPTLARYVRLSIDQPTQGAMNKASIFEFQVYATDMKYYDLDDTLAQAQSFQLSLIHIYEYGSPFPFCALV